MGMEQLWVWECVKSAGGSALHQDASSSIWLNKDLYEKARAETAYTLYCQKYWVAPLLMNRFDYFSNFHEYKS